MEKKDDKRLLSWGIFFTVIGFIIVTSTYLIDIILGGMFIAIGASMTIVNLVQYLKDKNKKNI